MAKEDARLREQGMSKTKIIDALAAAMPHRTREAVNYHRLAPAYTDLVKSYMVDSGNDGGDYAQGPPPTEGKTRPIQ